MKRKLLNAALLLFLCLFWLEKYGMRDYEWGYVAAYLAATLCLLLIPQRIAAPAAAAVITIGAGLIFERYFIGFAPGVFACAAITAAASGKRTQPPQKDAVLLTTLGAILICTGVSLYDSLVTQKNAAFMHPALERYHIFAAAGAAFVAGLAVYALCAHIKNRAPRGGATNYTYIRLAAAFAGTLIAFAAIFICYLKEASNGRVSLFPVFTGTFTAAAEGVYAMLKMDESGRKEER